MSFSLIKDPSNDPIVTVIVPAYNHARYVVDALDSVRAQTFQRWKLIVIDDGSTDQTWTRLCDYCSRVADERIQILTQENSGSHATINRGMAMSNTPYLSILNSDDLYSPNRLQKLVDVAATIGGDVFITTGVCLIDENGQEVDQAHWWQSMYRDLLARWRANLQHQVDNPVAQSLLWGNFTVSTSNFFMSRGVWERVGSFKHLKYVPDWDYALRTVAIVPNAFHFLPEMSLLYYRLHGQNTILGGVLRNHLEALRVLRTFQKTWANMGHPIPELAIDRMHYLNRFMRHEHTRLLLENQKKGWVEQVQALRTELDRVLATNLLDKSEIQHWQGQAEHWQGQAEHWQGQAEHWQGQSEHWQGQAEHWQGQSEHWQGQSEHWQGQSEHWHHEAEQWRQLAEQMQASWSWRLSRPLRYGKGKVAQVHSQMKLWLARASRKLRHDAKRLVDPYQLWLKAESLALAKQKVQVPIEVENMPVKPLFSVVMPVYNTPADFLLSAVTSVRSQWYENWELCICNDASDDPSVKILLDELEKTDPRIKCVARKVSGHIVLATNDAISIAKGQFIVFLDHDDMLAPQALYALAQKLNHTSDADLIYSDEDKIDTSGQRCLPFFKPDWSPALLWSQNYVGHLMCVRHQLLVEVGGLQPGTQGSQDHDLVLRLASRQAKIVHMPGVLYHWRLHAASTAANPDAKPYAHRAGRDAVARHLASQYAEQFDRVDDSEFPFVYLPRFKLPLGSSASIIIPTRDKIELLIPCIDSIRRLTANVQYEIIILDNGSKEPETAAYFEQLAGDKDIRIIDAPIEFNWSRLNNIGRQHAKGQVLVFLNNDTTIIAVDWLQRLMEYALLPDVATVGPLLLYPDGTIQHAGVVVGMGGWADHVFKGQALVHYPSPFVSSMVPRNVLANTGACIAIAADHYDKLGGFDEAFEICGSDVDLGIRAHHQGYSNVYLPSVRLYHLESKTRSSHIPEVDFQQSALKYAPYRTDGDPFYNRHLNPNSASPTPLFPDDAKLCVAR